MIEERGQRKSVRFAGIEEEDVEEEEEEGSRGSGESSDEGEGGEESNESGDEEEKQSHRAPPGPPPGPPPGLLSGTAPPLIRAPPPAPPGPPPLLFPRMGIPPGPPPGVPPPNRPPLRAGFAAAPPRPLIPPNPNRPHIQSQAVLSARPTRNPTATNRSKGSGSGATISAQPQLRNMQAEVTKFMPTSLRVRRDQPKFTKGRIKPVQPPIVTAKIGATAPPAQPMIRGGKQQGTVQGDAYDAFMKEMQGLL